MYMCGMCVIGHVHAWHVHRGTCTCAACSSLDKYIFCRWVVPPVSTPRDVYFIGHIYMDASMRYEISLCCWGRGCYISSASICWTDVNLALKDKEAYLQI
eukprot:jgi/Botrbrau1/7499/Bobra.0095s0035.1